MAIVLITGGSSGIGLATVRRLAAAGHQVFSGSRDPARSGLPGGVTAVTVDVGDPDEVARAIEDCIGAAAPPARIVVGADDAGMDKLARQTSPEGMARLLRDVVAGLTR